MNRSALLLLEIPLCSSSPEVRLQSHYFHPCDQVRAKKAPRAFVFFVLSLLLIALGIRDGDTEGDESHQQMQSEEQGANRQLHSEDALRDDGENEDAISHRRLRSEELLQKSAPVLRLSQLASVDVNVKVMIANTSKATRIAPGIAKPPSKPLPPPPSPADRRYPPEAQPFERNGKKFRRCAVAVVFNECGHVLLGERLRTPASPPWQFPQGGVLRGEAQAKAAARELYEEVGLSNAKGVRLVDSLPESAECCYEVDGSWLTKAGYAGQILFFTLFFLPGCEDPTSVCDLSGLGGEEPEFSAVRWSSMAEAAAGVWGPKKPAYAYLERFGGLLMDNFLASKGSGQLELLAAARNLSKRIEAA